jgi:hypothetical protein
MGRRPNPLILEYFERGPKLNDNSNRYPHTCKQCGENFPKGRIDSLTTHITKRCPAISDSERMRACLELHGITQARTAAERHQQVQAAQAAAQANGQQMSPSALPQGWSALETLAEASRQVDLNENSRVNKAPSTQSQTNDSQNGERFELQEQYTLDNPPASYEATRAQANGKKGEIPLTCPKHDSLKDPNENQVQLFSKPRPRPRQNSPPRKDFRLSYRRAKPHPTQLISPLRWLLPLVSTLRSSIPSL